MHKREFLPKIAPGDVTDSWPTEHPSGAVLIQARNIRIMGEPGTELIVGEPQSSALVIVNSENVRISDLCISYDPPVSVCGVVTSVQPPDTLEVVFDAGADPEADYFHADGGFRGLFRFHSEELLPGTNRPANSNAVPHQGGAILNRIGERRYLVKCRKFLPLSENYRPGLRFAYYARSWGNAAISSMNSSHTRLERIRLSDSPSIAFSMRESDMPIVSQCSIEPQNGRWTTTAADAFYLRNGFGGLFLRNRVSFVGDDFLNIHGRMNLIHHRRGNELYFVGNAWMESILKNVTRAAITRFGRGENYIAAELPVKAVEILPPMPKSAWKTVKVVLDGDPGELVTVETSNSTKCADCLFFPEREWQGLLFLENDLRHGISRIMVGGRNLVIADNSIEDSLYNACLFDFTQFDRRESHFPFHVKVSGNRITSLAKVVFEFEGRLQPKESAMPPKEVFNSNFVDISDNRLVMYGDWAKAPFCLRDSSGLTVSANVICSSGTISAPVFRCQAPLSAVLEDNIITGKFLSTCST